MNETRRAFLKQTAAATALLASPAAITGSAVQISNNNRGPTASPWYRRTLRWGQTNITERDPARYDIAAWRAHWKRTRVQGIIINAGGIVAYYASKVPLHRPWQR